MKELSTQRISVSLSDEQVIQVEVTQVGREDVAVNRKAFQDVANSLESLIQEIAKPIHKAMPTKATVKFGVDVGIESGQLTAAIVKGSSSANLEITLEWIKESRNAC